MKMSLLSFTPPTPLSFQHTFRQIHGHLHPEASPLYLNHFSKTFQPCSSHHSNLHAASAAIPQRTRQLQRLVKGIVSSKVCGGGRSGLWWSARWITIDRELLRAVEFRWPSVLTRSIKCVFRVWGCERDRSISSDTNEIACVCVFWKKRKKIWGWFTAALL